MSSRNEISLMLLVDIKSKKLMSAEVGKEFVDFVFSLLTLPVGAVAKLISVGAMHGSIGRLCTRRLMKPTIARPTDEPYADVWRGIAPGEHGEGLQVLHYEVGQKYESHFHYFLDGQRMATILMYLSDVEEGGETIFPDANVNNSSLPWYNELSECARKDLAVKPKMGDALLFWSMKLDATLDPLSLHGDCPVIKGNKWSSTKWLHVGEYKA
ncbi:Prolyl 4-hydroxylase subunit alpha-1 [Hordeum vulgare]|nr:Prolyl 4-hydroxylase subunit alpha-1 [Hordeum vulgare]